MHVYVGDRKYFATEFHFENDYLTMCVIQYVFKNENRIKLQEARNARGPIEMNEETIILM